MFYCQHLHVQLGAFAHALQIIVVNTNKTEGLDESSNFGVLTTDLAAPGAGMLAPVSDCPLKV